MAHHGSHASHATGPVGPAPQEHQVVYTTLHFDKPWSYENYLKVGGYAAWRKILAEKIPPEQIISLGDETRDIDAAREVGIRAAAVLWGYAEPEAFAHLNPDLAFATPADVVAHVAASAKMDRQP